MNEEYSFEDLAPWFALIITVVGGLLRILLLGTKGMWLDETASVWLAYRPVGDLLQWVAAIDPHPPLYYLLLHGWMGIMGPNPYEVRLLSVVFGTATIPLIYLIGKRLSGQVVGLAAATFLAFSLFNIYYAQEARMYTLLTFNAAAAIYALACLLTDPRSADPLGSQVRDAWRAWRSPAAPDATVSEEFTYQPKPTGWRARLANRSAASLGAIGADLAWAGLVVFSALTLLTHSIAFLFVLSTNLFVLGLWLWQRVRKAGPAPALQPPRLANWLIAQVAIFVLWSPWLLGFIQQAGRVSQEFWIPFPTWESVGLTLQAMAFTSAPGEGSQFITLGLLAIVLVLGGVYYRKRWSVLLLLVTLFAVPLLGELIISLQRPIFYGRTLIWITIPLYLLLAAGIAQLRHRVLMLLVMGIVVGSYLFAAADYFRFYGKEDWSTPAGYVANFAQDGDLVLFNSNFVEIPFNYYFAPWEEQYSLELVKQGVPLDLIDTQVLEPRMNRGDVPALQAMISGHDRVWLVYSHSHYTDPEGIIPATLAAEMKLSREREFYGGKVQLYEAN